MSLQSELYQIETSAKELEKESEGAKEVGSAVKVFLDEKEGLAGRKVADVVESYRPGKQLKDEDVDLIGTVGKSLPELYKSLENILGKGLSYKNARKTAQRLMKTVSYLKKNIHRILEYIGKNDSDQLRRIVAQYKEGLDKAGAMYQLKNSVFLPYMKK